MDRVNLSPWLNMCSAGSRSVLSSQGVKENLFIALLHMQTCDQIARGDRSGCCFCEDYFRFCSGFSCLNAVISSAQYKLQSCRCWVLFFLADIRFQLLSPASSLTLSSFHKGTSSVGSLDVSCAEAAWFLLSNYILGWIKQNMQIYSGVKTIILISGTAVPLGRYFLCVWKYFDKQFRNRKWPWRID